MLQFVSFIYGICGIVASVYFGVTYENGWIAVAGVFASLISARIIYAIGAIEDNTDEILELLQKKSGNKKSKKKVKEDDEDNTYYVCQSCKSIITSDVCPKCGSLADNIEDVCE